jgi:flagellar biosynthesis chaperone FliJ
VKEVRISRHLQYRYRPFYATKQTDKEEKNNDDFAQGKNAGARSI